MDHKQSKNTRQITYKELFEDFSVKKGFPNLRHLSDIILSKNRTEAESELTPDDKEAITLSSDAIESAALSNGFEPLIVDFSLIMDERRQGLRENFGYYHAFCSVNTVDHEAVWKAYIDAIYKEHRKNPDRREGYESIVTHVDLFRDETAAVLVESEAISKLGLKLPKYINTNHVGAYRFDVEYVEKHRQNGAQNIEKFIQNFAQEFEHDETADDQRNYFLAIPFRRAQFQPVGELANFKHRNLGTPGGVLFLFMRWQDKKLLSPEDSITRLVRRISWILSNAALGEAVGPVQKQVAQVDQATAAYGMAHPLKHRWGQVKTAAKNLQILVEEQSDPSQEVYQRARLLSTQTRAFGEWVELAYILYFAASMPFDRVAARLELFGLKVFLNSDDYDLLDSIRSEEKIADLLGEDFSKRVSIDIQMSEAPILQAAQASELGKRMPSAVYRQFLFEILTNARKYGAKKNGTVPVRVEKLVSEGEEFIVFTNPIPKIDHRMRDQLDDWWDWDYTSKPGGLSFVDQILRWTDTGVFKFRVDSKALEFQSALRVNGLIFR